MAVVVVGWWCQTVEAEAFWEGVPEMSFAGQGCRLQDTVNVIG